jgi:hypothetical protein
MTVVLAAIAGNGDAIIMASDRMLARASLTYQFEHDSPKIRQVNDYLIGYAGTTTFADDIVSHKYPKIKNTKEFVEEFSSFYIKYGNRLGSRVLLESVGLDLKTFNENPQKYPQFLQQKVYEKLGNAKLGVSFIICGYDEDQPQIYVIGEYGLFSTAHSIGYTAIGIGEPHVANFYMVNGFKFDTPLKEAIYFAYQAKRSAEIAGGVGECTDIYVLEKHKKPMCYKDGSKFIKDLNGIYEKHRLLTASLYKKEILPELDKLELEEAK